MILMHYYHETCTFPRGNMILMLEYCCRYNEWSEAKKTPSFDEKITINLSAKMSFISVKNMKYVTQQ